MGAVSQRSSGAVSAAEARRYPCGGLRRAGLCIAWNSTPALDHHATAASFAAERNSGVQLGALKKAAPLKLPSGVLVAVSGAVSSALAHDASPFREQAGMTCQRVVGLWGSFLHAFASLPLEFLPRIGYPVLRAGCVTHVSPCVICTVREANPLWCIDCRAPPVFGFTGGGASRQAHIPLRLKRLHICSAQGAHH